MKLAFILLTCALLFALFMPESSGSETLSLTDEKECTSILAGKNTTADGSVFNTYSCDGAKYCYLRYTPRERHENESYAVFSFEGKKLGEIPQVNETYAVWSSMDGTDYNLPSGGMNEHGVSIAETTIPGKDALFSENCAIDYPNLMFLALQRSKSSREAIEVMSDLVDTYGFNMAYGGECITVADAEEAWAFEVFGPGKGWKQGEPGAVWAARRVKDDEVFVSANRARIGRIEEEDMTSSNIRSLAEKLGLWDGKKEFVWYDVYGEDQGRYSSLREWRVFSLLAPSEHLSPEEERYSFSIEPDRDIGLEDLMSIYRDTYEGTEFDITENDAFYVNGTKSAIAGPYGRRNTRDDLWDLLGIEGERTISQSRTGFSFINQLRSNGLNVMWFANDCPGTSVYVPIYAGTKNLPEKWLRCNDETSDDSAWWTFDVVNNLAFQSRYQYAIEDIQKTQRSVEDQFLKQQKAIESTALKSGNRDDFLERYSYKCADDALKAYEALERGLIYKYYAF
jgi:dipeptidase